MLGEALSALIGGQPQQPTAGPLNFAGPLQSQLNKTLAQAGPVAPKKPGTLAMGGGLRNVLGAIGDALLVAHGRNPIYRDRLQNFKEANAVEGFQADPMGAIGRLARVNPKAAMDRYDQLNDNSRLDRSEARLARAADADFEGSVIDRALRLAGAATPQNYGAIKQRINTYTAKHGVQLPVDLPDQYDPDAISKARNAGIPVGQQVDNEDQAAYRQEVLDDRRETHRNATEDRQASLEERSRNNRLVDEDRNLTRAYRTAEQMRARAQRVREQGTRQADILTKRADKVRSDTTRRNDAIRSGKIAPEPVAPALPPVAAKGKVLTGKGGERYVSDGQSWVRQ